MVGFKKINLRKMFIFHLKKNNEKFVKFIKN